MNIFMCVYVCMYGVGGVNNCSWFYGSVDNCVVCIVKVELFM